MDALKTLLDVAIEWRGAIVEHVQSLSDASFRVAGEAALGAFFGLGARDKDAQPSPSPPSAPAREPPPRRRAMLSQAQSALVERALDANARELALPVPGPPPAGPSPKDVLRAALTDFLQGDDPRGARVVTLVAEQCTQEAQDLAVVMAEDQESAARRNGAKPKSGAARAWADAGAIAYLNHPKIALARFQKAHDLGADDVETRIWLGTLYYRLGRVGEAEQCYRAAEERVWPDDQETRAIILCNLGCVCVTRGALEAADTHFQSALRLVETIGDKSRQSAMIGNLGLVAYTRGDLISANDLCRRALALAEEAGDKERAAMQYGNLGVLATDRGDAKLAREYFEQALDLYEEMGAEEHEGARNVRAHLAEL